MDKVKPTAASAIRRLQAAGITTVLLTGDNARTAQAVADTLGIARGAGGGAARRQGRGNRPAASRRPPRRPWWATA